MSPEAKIAFRNLMIQIGVKAAVYGLISAAIKSYVKNSKTERSN